MPFVKDDPNINRVGRIPKKEYEEKEAPKTNRQKRNKEFHMLLRKLKPHVANAVITAADIMGDATAKHVDKLKAATILLDTYRKATLDIYGPDFDELDSSKETDEANAEENEKKTPVFSLKVLN